MKVSVIIPVFNVEEYIRDCLDSVTRQSLRELEIICINDAGTDGSWDIVKEYAGADSRIRMIENPTNLGLASTRNKGIEAATGEYIYFLDSDDMIRQDALSRLYEASELEQLDVAIFMADFIYESKSLKEKFGSDPAVFKGDYPEVLSGQSLFKEWMKVWDWMPSQPRYFYRRDFVQDNKIRFIDGQLHEDETFAFDVLMNAEKVKVIKEPLFIRRFRADSIMSSKPTMKNVESCVRILDNVYSYETDDKDLIQAKNNYAKKIFNDAARKYKAVKRAGLSTQPTEEMERNKKLMKILKDVQAKQQVELFACSSYYQILISLALAMTKDIEIDLVLEEHGIETAGVLAEQIRDSLPNIVRNVYVCPTSEQVDPYIERETAADSLKSRKITEHIEGIIKDVDIRYDYDNINVFWDLGYIGTYLNIKKIRYTLHEEKRADHRGVVPFGYSPYAASVEVNEIKGIEIPTGKVHENPRGMMIQKLTEEQKTAIFRAFIGGLNPLSKLNLGSDNSKTILILTEPFALTGRLPDEEAQIKLYNDIYEKYGGNGQNTHVIIKAHPRDTVDYEKYFPEAFILERNIPMEVLNFDKRFSIDVAVTVTSSAIYGLEMAEEKIYLGAEYYKK